MFVINVSQILRHMYRVAELIYKFIEQFVLPKVYNAQLHTYNLSVSMNVSLEHCNRS